MNNFMPNGILSGIYVPKNCTCADLFLTHLVQIKTKNKLESRNEQGNEKEIQ